nr:hypothetical protein [Tanacetum cinerariifolium]
ETYKNVSQDIRDQLNAEAEAVQIIRTWIHNDIYSTVDACPNASEAVQIILTGIDNDIYSTVDACPNACEMWKAIERLKQGESINVQDLETNLFWEFGKFTSLDGESLESYYLRFYKLMNELTRNKYKVTNHQQHQHEVNEIRVKKIARVANPLALVAQQQQVNHHQTHPTHFNQNSSNRTHQSATRKREKAVVNSPQPIYDQEPSMEEAGIQLNAEQADWKDDTDDESEDQELEAHYMYMAKIQEELEAHYMYMAQLQEVSPDAADSGPIFDAEPLQKVSNDDHYNVFAIESAHLKKSKSVHDTYPIKQDAHNMIIDSLDMSHDREEIDQNDDDNDLANERELLASLIEKLKCEIDESKNRNKVLETSNKVLIEKLKEMKDKLSAHQETISILSQQKEAQIKLYKTCEDNELVKVIALENKVKVLDNIVYKTDQSVQTMNVLNNKCRMSFLKPEFLKKAQRENPRLYDIDSLRSQLETHKTQFLNEIDRLSKEYYYADHMNAILGVYIAESRAV